MKISYVDICGFRGYRQRARIDFAEAFTIIDGRNGVGKSTIFDAIEFALTGALTKYKDAKAAGETVSDYLWWTGDGPAPSERYVEAGFTDGETSMSIRRSQFADVDAQVVQQMSAALCDAKLAPAAPLSQLCAASIIRDEHITSLSLDLKEADRYALLRETLGASDADEWIERGARLVAIAKQRTSDAQSEVTSANAEVAAVARRLDEIRSGLVSDSIVAETVGRLQAFADTAANPEQLTGPVRERMANVADEIDRLQMLSGRWNNSLLAQKSIDSLSSNVSALDAERESAEAELKAFPSPDRLHQSSALANEAKELVALIGMGRRIGLRENHCPLCAADRSHEEFDAGLRAAEDLAQRLNEDAARAAKQEQARQIAEDRIAEITKRRERAAYELESAKTVIRSVDEMRENLHLAHDVTRDQIEERTAHLRQSLDSAQKDLRILETLRLNAELERAQQAESDAQTRLARAQERFGRARKGLASAQALHDAARRASSETLDRRLERVLPLMSELYRRLRPHPTWSNIEYSIRGDVRRFMKLQVGDDLNPQFLFSSGQRRATGLAFLLSVNLSLAWSKWRSILLDDPVQHVDDFRAVHLAEVASQLVTGGRQVICAVEDEALADLLCRRLPVDHVGAGKRLTLGPNADGALAVLSERALHPLVQTSIVGTTAGPVVA